MVNTRNADRTFGGSAEPVAGSRTERLNGSLRHLRMVSTDIIGAALVTMDGFIVSSVLPTEVDEELIGGMAASILGVGERISEDLMNVEMEQVYVRSPKGYVIVNAINDDTAILLLVTREAKLGLIFLELKRAVAGVHENPVVRPEHQTLGAGLFLVVGLGNLAVVDLYLVPRYLGDREAAVAHVPELPPESEPEPEPEPELESAPALETEVVTEPAQPDFVPGHWVVQFEYGHVRVTVEAERLLRRVIEHHSRWPGRLRIEGHSDQAGPEVYNQALSLRRARAIEAWLAARGVPRQAMTTVGFGETHPIATGTDARANRLNRRVEIRLEEP